MNQFRTNAALVLVFAMLFLSCQETSENKSFTFSSSEKVISLRGHWKFEQGDDPSWSSPDYDDARWTTVDVPDVWIVRGLPASGKGWYRTWIFVENTDSSEEASIWVRGVINAAEVFWDGKLVGRRGTIDQTLPIHSDKIRRVQISIGKLLTPGRHLLALRVANSHFFTGGIDEAPSLGFSSFLLQRWQRSRAIFGFLAGVFVLSCIHLLILFAGDRTRREYLYFALLSIACAVFIVLIEMPELWGIERREYALIGRIASFTLLSLPVLMYLFLALRFDFNVRWLKRCIVIVSACAFIPDLLPLAYQLPLTKIMKVRDLWIQCSFLISLYVVAWATWKRKPGSRTLVTGVLAIAIGTIASFAVEDSVWGFSSAALFTVMMTISLSREMSRIQREVRNMRDTFRLFVPKPVLDRIAKRGLESIRLGGAEESEATILFIDIKSFTSVAERLSPNQTLDFLNAFMRRMQPLINAQGGFINQFVGDEIMAIFHNPGHGIAAVETAVAVRKELDSFNMERRGKGESIIEVGIGINSGGIIWGTIGSEVRMESAVIGDPVNLASRLQSLTRLYGAWILGSEYVVQQIPDMSRYAYREVDIVQVKGKTRAVAVYEFFDGDPEPIRSQKREIVEPFMQGIARYRANEWEPAEVLFNKCIDVCPEDSVAKMYVDRCRAMRLSPPGASWGGVTVHDRK